MAKFLKNEPFTIVLTGSFSANCTRKGRSAFTGAKGGAGFYPAGVLDDGGNPSNFIGLEVTFDSSGIFSSFSDHSIHLYPIPPDDDVIRTQNASGSYRIWYDMERYFTAQTLLEEGERFDVSDASFFIPEDNQNHGKDTVYRGMYDEQMCPRPGGTYGVEISCNGQTSRREVAITSRTQNIPLRNSVSYGGRSQVGPFEQNQGDFCDISHTCAFQMGEIDVPFPSVASSSIPNAHASKTSCDAEALRQTDDQGNVAYGNAASFGGYAVFPIKYVVSGQAHLVGGGTFPEPITVELPGMIDDNGALLKIDCDASGAFSKSVDYGFEESNTSCDTFPMNQFAAGSFPQLRDAHYEVRRGNIQATSSGYSSTYQITCRLTNECAERVVSTKRYWTFKQKEFPGARFDHAPETVQWAAPWMINTDIHILQPPGSAMYSGTSPQHGFLSVVPVQNEAGFPAALRMTMETWDTSNPGFFGTAPVFSLRPLRDTDRSGYRFYKVRLRTTASDTKTIALTLKGILIGASSLDNKVPVWTLRIPGGGEWHTFTLDVYHSDLVLLPAVVGRPSLDVPYWKIDTSEQNCAIDLLYIKGVQTFGAKVNEIAPGIGEVDALPLPLDLSPTNTQNLPGGWNLTDLSPPAPGKPDFYDSATQDQFYDQSLYYDSDLWSGKGFYNFGRLGSGAGVDHATPYTMPARDIYDVRRGLLPLGSVPHIHFEWWGRAQLAASVIGDNENLPDILTYRADNNETGGSGTPDIAGWAVTGLPNMRPGYLYKARPTTTLPSADNKHIAQFNLELDFASGGPGIYEGYHHKRLYARFFCSSTVECEQNLLLANPSIYFPFTPQFSDPSALPFENVVGLPDASIHSGETPETNGDYSDAGS